MNIVLVGFMGTGKTTIAIELSHRLGMKYVSIDDLIEKKERRTINEIFTKSGEDYFRDVESAVIRDAVCMDNLVIDTGGGAVMRDENVAYMKSNGVIVCLTADADVIMERTKKYKHRPLLNVEDPKRKIRDLLARRSPYYAKADHTIDTGKFTVRQVIDKIAEIAEARLKRREGPKDES
ncbi:MAG: shikimate kinase [Candidatus Omnitrophica bacterium]|nr:shikimate kinase [Candidatus Omnitrophota bacterium]